MACKAELTSLSWLARPSREGDMTIVNEEPLEDDKEMQGSMVSKSLMHEGFTKDWSL
jgi:hypothetical protein